MPNPHTTFTPHSRKRINQQERVLYKGDRDDFIVFLDDMDEFEKYKNGNDTSIPLSNFLGNFSVYRTISGNGSSGVLELASGQELNEEFGDFESIEDDVIPQILRKGEVQNLGKN